MKKFIATIFTLAITCMAMAQTLYTSIPDPKHDGGIILNGTITKYALANNAAFNWYGSSQQNYKPAPTVLTSMQAAKGNVKFIVFGGSWCEDTQFVLPKFFKLQELATVPDEDVSFFGVDRSKKTIGNVASAFNITNVPTIIVMKAGKEVGRIVEYGTTGKWDEELAALLK